MKTAVAILRTCAVVVVASLCAWAQTSVPAEVAGPWLVGTRTLTFAGTTGGNGSVGALVRYPATTAGANAPFNTAAGARPVVVFGHGFSLQASLYETLYAHWASHGWVVLAPTTEQALFVGNLPRFIADMKACVLGIRTASATPGNALFGSVPALVKATAMGHSFGGAAALVAASQEPALFNGVVSMAATSTSPQNVDILTAVSLLAVPCLHMGASQDTIVPVGSNLDPIYNATPVTVSKRSVVIAGGTHGRFHQASGIDWLTEAPPSIPVEEQQRLIRRYATSFMTSLVKRDPVWMDVFLGPTATADAGLSAQATGLAEAWMFTGGAAVQGQPIVVAAARRPGDTALLAFGTQTLAAPTATPFGDLFIDPATLALTLELPVGPASWAALNATVPVVAGLSGVSFPCQALVGSGTSFDLSDLFTITVQ